MRIGLKTRLRLISLLPILILFSITSYFAYESFLNYKSASHLQEKLSENRLLNTLLGNLSRERGMTVMYLGNSSKNTYTSLQKQRSLVDKAAQNYINVVANNKDGSSIVESVNHSMNDIKDLRVLVDAQDSNFKDIYENVYGKALNKIIGQLETITQDQTDAEIKDLIAAYIEFVRVQEATSSERDLISFALARDTAIESDQLNLWISLISRSELIRYDHLSNKKLVKTLDALYKDTDNKELLGDINLERTDIIAASASEKDDDEEKEASKDSEGQDTEEEEDDAAESDEEEEKESRYETGAGIWFTMLSEKVNIISKAQEALLNAMDLRANKVQENALQILIISVTVWIVSILFALLGYLLSNEIEKNVQGLENVLKTVAEDTRDTHGHDIDINLHSADGTEEAYKLLEKIIDQTREDKIAAQEASEAKSMFLANMSHEIRTPLNGIVGFTELLKDTGLEDEQSEFVEIIEKSSENLLEIINNILDLSKIESNKLEIEDIAFNPITEFESAVDVYAVRASEKHIDLGCFIDPELEKPLKGDPTKLKEIIINLLSNAVKFTSSSGAINVNIRKVTPINPEKTAIRFEVQDSGIGVTSEQKARIFEAFGQADTSITRKYGGTGLGLTISSKFVELMGGQLDLHSETGKGTTFFFTIEFEEIESTKESKKDAFSHLKALILEDDYKSKSQATYLKEYLDFHGVNYAVFKDMETLETLSSQAHYDLLFADYDYCSEAALQHYSQEPQDLVLLTKATYMKKLENLDIDILKILYEPLNNSKLISLFENYTARSTDALPSKKVSRKKFDVEGSRFHANVLVAEDNIINQKLIKRTLEDIGLTVTLASNGLEAFQKRKDENFDLIFMDIQMPFLDGMEATKEILEYETDHSQPHIPIIALTANALKGDRERFLAAGLDEYTTKPLVRNEIISLLNHFISDHIIDDNGTPLVQQTETSIVEEEHLGSTAAMLQSETTNLEPQAENSPELLDETAEVAKSYTADILLAKQSMFESKLYAQLLKSLGYSFDIANSKEEFEQFTDSNNYKVVLFDKECEGLNLEEFSQRIKSISETNNLKTSLILITDSSMPNDPSDKVHVDETIKNVINKDLLRLVIEKFI